MIGCKENVTNVITIILSMPQVLNLDFFGYVSKEIVSENFGNSHEQFSINGFTHKYIIDIATIAVQLLSKPQNGPCFWPVIKHLFYGCSDVHL